MTTRDAYLDPSFYGPYEPFPFGGKRRVGKVIWQIDLTEYFDGQQEETTERRIKEIWTDGSLIWYDGKKDEA